MKLGPLWICVLLSSCGSSKPAPAPPHPETPVASEPVAPPRQAPPPAEAEAPVASKSLYERLGGRPAITAVVDEYIERIVADPRIKYRFLDANPVNAKRLATEFVCKATGGPVAYTGRDLAIAHAGMDLVDDEFGALVEDLVGALDKFHVPEREKNDLLGALGPLKPTIVVPATRLRPIPDAELAEVSRLAATLSDKNAAELLGAAVIAGKRGQRSYAEQLFSRAEIAVGAPALASVSEVMRAGAPPRIQTAVKSMKDAAPQPVALGKSDDDEPRKRLEAGKLHGSLRLEGKPVDGMGLVMLWPKATKLVKRKPKFRVVEQRNKTFAPHILAVPVGSTVAFPNFDSIYHNVFSLSQPQRFDLGMYKSGDMRQVVFDKPGIIRLGCNIHANMSAYLVVVDAPHYVVADQDGAFAFRSLKPGKYKMQAWSERSAEPVISEITIKPGDNQAMVDLKGGAAAGPSEDKFGGARGP